MYIDNPDIAQFLSPDVQRAADIDSATFRNWATRKPAVILLTDEDREAIGDSSPSFERPAGGSGRSHLLTYRRALQVAVTAELVRLGLSPRRAGVAAAGWTDLSSHILINNETELIEIIPGQLFPDGWTVLVVRPDVEFGKVVNIAPASGESAFSLVVDLFSEGRKSAAVVNLTRLDRRLKDVFDLPKGWGKDWQTVRVGGNRG